MNLAISNAYAEAVDVWSICVVQFS